MDLEEFDNVFEAPEPNNFHLAESYVEGLKLLDNLWFVKATRSARWMDLLGDYAGTEPFVIDGEALLQVVLDDPLLLIGREGYSFQILHAYYTLENILGEYQRRSANFEIAFWNNTKHLTIRTGDTDFTMASRVLARSMLFLHLAKLPFAIHVFENPEDPLWVQYILANKPMFVMTNDGGLPEESDNVMKTASLFVQRAFLLELMSQGLSITLLKGAEYRDSKILSFVYDPGMIAALEKLLQAVKPKIVSTIRGLDRHLSQEPEANYHLRVATSVDNNWDTLFGILRDVLVKESVPPEIAYLFIVHSLLIPSLSAQERAQVPRDLGSDWTLTLCDNFLSPLFFRLANVLASHNYCFELDGTLFGAILVYVLLQDGELDNVLALSIQAEAQKIWSLLRGPSLDFHRFTQNYRLPKPGTSYIYIQHNIIEPRRLLEFSHPIFDDEFSTFQASHDVLDEESFSAKFDAATKVLDNQHWHNQKSILPSHLGGNKPKPVDERARRRMLRSDQRYMANLQVQAASLTGASGAILRQIVIAPVRMANVSQQNRKAISYQKKAPVLSSVEKLKLKIKEEKQSGSKNSSQIRWTQQIDTMSNMSLLNKVDSMKIFSRNPKIDAPEILLEMQLYRIHLDLEMWIENSERESSQVRDRYTVSIMRMMKDISQLEILTPSVTKALSTVLIILGFRDYIPGLLSATKFVDKRLSFRFIKLIDSKTEIPLYPFMAITEHPIVWQLRLFGEFMDRSMASSPDRRVSFQPDAWQRRVLDGIDQNKSLLVVAPTSAGKTFISYYAMEKVLRESDDGILVYIAPTKALVTQIAAEVYARFSKSLKGKSCWAIHTRDFRIHEPQNCQILVTVPEMLAIMILSPPLAKTWTPRIKLIVLDEIHSIGQQEGGAVWEQILLFAPCPVIGLSATIGAPELFSNWLSSVQKEHGFKYDFIRHEHRYSHLRKFFYLVDGEGTFKSLDDHLESSRARFLHPIGLLSFGARTLPHDLSLEAGDTLTLFSALYKMKERLNSDLEALKPTIFFGDSAILLRQKDVLRYEAQLKSVLEDLLKVFDPRDRATPLGEVIYSLQDPELAKLEELSKSTVSRFAFKNDLLVLLADLHSNNDLPAILFNFDRSNCEIMAQHLLQQLEESENEWRLQSPEWNRKVKQWVIWKEASLARERAAERLKKFKKSGKDEDELRDAPDASWESSFNPNEPSPQFSFVGHRAAYSKSDLEKDLEGLKWTTIPQWAFQALRRGIAVHHAGMNKHYRSLIESLFRQGFVRVMIATGTLALGINAPAKTAVFCGDSPFLTALMYRQCAGRAGRRGFDLMGKVIFYGLPLDRVRRLVLSRLPTLGGNFPLTSTMTLRLFSLLDGSNNADVAVRAIKSMISLPQITISSDFGRDQLLHHLRFSIEYLRRSRLLDKKGSPINLFSIVSHLYYTEPSNFALVSLMRSGVLHEICNQSDLEFAKRDFMVIMANLFGRRYMSKIFTKEDNIRELTLKYPSMIVLPPLPESARQALLDHDKEILLIFLGYVFAFAKKSEVTIGQEDTLPLSKIQFPGIRSHQYAERSPFHVHLRDNAIPVVVRSVFVANSGHNDAFSSVPELTRTSRAALNLNEHAIPSMSQFTITANSDTLEHRLNAYILDFYIHGQVHTLAKANGIRRGDVWYLLQDFHLTLLTVEAALKKLLIVQASKDSKVEDSDPVDGIQEMDDDYEDKEDAGPTSDFSRPDGLSSSDWNVYTVVSQVCKEFQDKFKAMWA